MRTALFLAGVLIWFVLMAYVFALASRRDVIGECFEHATADQAAVCRALSRDPIFH